MYYRYLKFTVSGIITAVVGLSTLWALTDVLGVWYLLGSVMAHTMALTVNFALQKYWTFLDRERRGLAKKAYRFMLVSVANLALNTALMYMLVDALHVHHLYAQALVMGMLAVLNYTLYSSLVFHSGARAERGTEGPPTP